MSQLYQTADRPRSPDRRQYAPDLSGVSGQASLDGQPSLRPLPKQRTDMFTQPSYDGPSSRRKPVPSPLQSADTFQPVPVIEDDSCSGSPHSLPFPRPPAGNVQPMSARSITYQPATGQDQQRSPRERLDALLATAGSEHSPAESPKASNTSGDSPLERSANSPSKQAGQNRNVSAPNPLGRPSGGPPNPSSPMVPLPTAHRPEMRPMLRTSSIDSAISSISSHSHKSSQDAGTANTADIAHLIAAAGSAEAVIHHLLKEKQSSAAQNAQLWRLVDKQRAMILGLNKDLERALKDKDRYRRKLKDQAPQTQAVAALAADGGRAHSGSPPSLERRGTPVDDRASISDSISGELQKLTAASAHDGDHERGVPRAGASRERNKDLLPSALNVHPLQAQKRKDAPVSTTADPAAALKVTIPAQHKPSKSADGASPSKLVSPFLHQADGKSSPRSFGEQRATRGSLSDASPSFTLTETAPTPIVPRKLPPSPLNLTKKNRASAHLHQVGPEEHSDSDYDDILEVDEIPAFERGRRRTREDDDRERELAAQRELENRSQSKKSKGLKSPPDKPAPDMRKLDPVPDAVKVPLPFSPMLRQTIPISPPSNRHSALLSPNSLAAVLGGALSPPPPADGITQRMVSPPPLSPGLPLSPRPMDRMVSPTPMSPGLPSSPRPTSRMVSPQPISPGLPTSPRPGDRPLGSPTPRMPRDGASLPALASPPLSPRLGPPAMPLSPRAPKYAIPLPPNTPMSIISPGLPKPGNPTLSPPPQVVEPNRTPAQPTAQETPANQPRVQEPPETAAPLPDHPAQVYRGFMSADYPDLLLPPGSLSSIDIKVSSSRLRPSRASFISGKTKASEEEAVFTLGVFARADRRELWRVEKDLMSLPMLDHNLKSGCSIPASIPDRSLFSGHAPAKIDARRAALDHYFGAILGTQLDERTALILCRFLSTDALEPDIHQNPLMLVPLTAERPSHPSAPVKTRKEGYLTKRGKNFGGWKARFFCLDGPILRYYESPGGPHLGTIKLLNAQIGKQSQKGSNSSPSRSDAEDRDNQYRHAFLILEPKKKDSASLVRHVLCAESDTERDAWVSALLQYVDDQSAEDEQPTSIQVPAAPEPSAPEQARNLGPQPGQTAPRSVSNPGADGPQDSLRGVSYENTVQAEAPTRGSPSNRGSTTGNQAQASQGSVAHLGQFHSAMQISGPRNGVRIQDASSWGNKPKPLNLEKKEPKKRSMWGFKGRSSADLNTLAAATLAASNAQQAQRNPVRAVFGAHLAEAAEHSGPVGVDVYLPAVVYRCIEYLDSKNASSEEGIFRLSGSNVLIKSLRERFNNEGDINLAEGDQYYDVHAVASLLKLYLRELPATVLTRELHLDFLHVLEIDNKPDKIKALNVLVHKLPRPNHSLLRALSAFLITIVNNSDQNKMTTRNVGIVFSPTLNIPAPVLSMFINEFQDIFGPDPEDYSPSSPTTNIGVTVTTPGSEPSPVDIRSPRKQMFQDLPTPAYNQAAFPQSARGSQPSARASHYETDTGFAPQQPSARASHYETDTGFIPLRPTYEQPRFGQGQFGQAQYGQGQHGQGQQPQIQYGQGHFGQGHNGPIASAGQEFASLNGALAPMDAREAKARRRESSMLMMGGGMGQRQSSMPQLRDQRGMVQDDSAFG
ncbi:MAG: hypothetical protein M1832_005990 [Thelocarpon impressellum]|nr:MAG: hypothetical protein M1832_005990 [Thelocarpon impressellum]